MMNAKSKATVKRNFIPPFIDAQLTNDVVFSIKGMVTSGSGVILKEDADNGIVLEVDPWQQLKDSPDFGRRGAIEVYVTMDTDAEPNYADPASEPRNYIATKGVDAAWTQAEKDNGFTINIDKKYITGGSHYITLYVVPKNGNAEMTAPLSFFILTEASGGNPVSELVFDQQYNINGITQSNLTGVNPKKLLPATVPPYFGMRANDVITLFLGTSSTNLAAIPTPPPPFVVTAAQIGQRINVSFEEAALNGKDDGSADGPRFFSYTITNEAGYVSDMATPVMLQLAFGERPSGLQQPKLPDIADNFITDQLTCPLRIAIPKYGNVQSNDVVTLHFRNDKLGTRQIGTAYFIQTTDVALDPIFYFHVYHDDIREYDKSSVFISYDVGRGSSNIIKTASPELAATIDLTIPVGPRPDPTSPENKNLSLLTITSANKEINQITGTAVNQPATITIPFRQAGVTTGASYLAVGDVITVQWGTKVLTPSFTVDALPTKDITMVLPAADITASGSGNIPAHYTVTRTLSDNVHKGTSVSPKQNVVVNTTNVSPGGTRGLNKPYWLNRNFQETINIDTMKKYKGCNFVVAKYDNINIGDLIILKLEGTAGFDDVNGTLVPEAEYISPVYTITADNLNNSNHLFLVPPKPFYLLCQGVVHVTYTVQQGANGEIFTSEELVEYSDMKYATKAECTLPPEE